MARMDDEQEEEFLNCLVLDKHAPAETKALLLNALSFLFKDIIKNAAVIAAEHRII